MFFYYKLSYSFRINLKLLNNNSLNKNIKSLFIILKIYYNYKYIIFNIKFLKDKLYYRLKNDYINFFFI